MLMTGGGHPASVLLGELLPDEREAGEASPGRPWIGRIAAAELVSSGHSSLQLARGRQGEQALATTGPASGARRRFVRAPPWLQSTLKKVNVPTSPTGERDLVAVLPEGHLGGMALKSEGRTASGGRRSRALAGFSRFGASRRRRTGEPPRRRSPRRRGTPRELFALEVPGAEERPWPARPPRFSPRNSAASRAFAAGSPWGPLAPPNIS